MKTTQLLAILALSTIIASAQPEIFFGENASPYPPFPGGPNEVPKPTNLLATFQAAHQFYARLPGVLTETFETLADGSTPPYLMFGTDTDVAMLSGTYFVESFASSNSAVLGGYPFSGTNALALGGEPGQFFTLTFAAPQSAFGFFGADVEANALRLTFVATNGTRTDIPVPVTITQGSGGAFFFGVINATSPFNAVEFHNMGSRADGFNVDDLSIATRVAPRPVLGIRVSQVELCWETATNVYYQLLFRDASTTNQWLPFGGTVRGDGTRYYTNDSILPGQPHRFYEVILTNGPSQF